jgi:signal transduction histidine kinase
MQQQLIDEFALKALSDAALAVSSNLALDKVLRQIVESARKLVNARYGALGVPNQDGELVEFVHGGMEPGLVNNIGRLPRGHGLLGAILNEGRTIRIPKIGDDSRSVGFPPGHPEMHSFLGVPIRGAEGIIGNLYLTDKQGGDPFTDVDEGLIELLAAHAAIAIQNARLYEQVGRLAVVEERSRIGMDLHDGVIQAVYAVGLTLESTRLLLAEDQTEAIAFIDRAISGLNDAIGDMRNFILDLRPRRFEGNLSQGLARLAREFQANTMVPVIMHVPTPAAGVLPPNVARALFLTAQEALANVARHARADNVLIRLTQGEELVSLQVQDDGIGFDSENQTFMTGHGLANMAARAEELGGAVYIEAEPGLGTLITFELPIQNGQKHAGIG